MKNPKQCDCCRQAKIIDSRYRHDHWYRRYKCSCGKTWSSVEMRLDEGVKGKDLNAIMLRQYSNNERDYVADKLIKLAQ